MVLCQLFFHVNTMFHRKVAFQPMTQALFFKTTISEEGTGAGD